jgi:hypothetical protein
VRELRERGELEMEADQERLQEKF